MAKSKSVKSAAQSVTITVVGTIQPEPGKTYVSKGVVKDALRAAAKAAGGKWGFVTKSEDGNSFSILRESDWAVVAASRTAGSDVVLTVAPPPAAEVKVEPAPEVKPAKAAKPRKPKAKDVKAAVEATAEGVTVAPVIVPVADENSAFAF